LVRVGLGTRGVVIPAADSNGHHLSISVAVPTDGDLKFQLASEECMTATDSELLTLHRYYISANRMRTEFFAVLEKRPLMNVGGDFIEARLYMDLWYACLYVVIEGWNQLGLADQTIDALLESPNVSLLRRYRNSVFHFQRKYYDKRSMVLIKEGENVVSWVQTLNLEFGRFFLQRPSNDQNTGFPVEKRNDE
jgi:hypothetical protein